MENWKPVAGFEGSYSVSDAGRVRSERRIVSNGHGSRRMMPARILKPMAQQGYASVCLGRKNILVHRLVLEAFVGPRPEGYVCRHLNGTRSDNRLSNLVWGTHAENAADRKRHGTNAQGDTHARTVVSDSQCREIRKIHAKGISARSIARALGMSSVAVDKIVNGQRKEAIEAATRHLEPTND